MIMDMGTDMTMIIITTITIITITIPGSARSPAGCC